MLKVDYQQIQDANQEASSETEMMVSGLCLYKCIFYSDGSSRKKTLLYAGTTDVKSIAAVMNVVKTLWGQVIW